VTGTFAGLVPVKVVDGRTIGDASAPKRPVMERMRGLYKTLAMRSLTPIGEST
jgi:branched-chain amino acid aminotransferase